MIRGLFMKILDIPRELTSYEFYSNVLPKIMLAEENKIILDMSYTQSIESLVIPNLLCCAYKIRLNYNKICLFIPDTITGGILRNYLNEIGFTKCAQYFDLIDFMYDPFSGLDGKHIDPICNTLVLNANDSKDDIYRGVELCINPFSDVYLSKFQLYDSTQEKYINEITEFLEEILLNSKIHGRSFSITTLHANYSSKKIYISVSDLGCGFINSLKGIRIKDEKEAILLGVYKRKDNKVYGLFNVIRRVLEYGGRVRIHSNNTQIIFTPRILNAFMYGKLNSVKSFTKYNLKQTVQYDGVHIEIELPFEKG